MQTKNNPYWISKRIITLLYNKVDLQFWEYNMKKRVKEVIKDKTPTILSLKDFLKCLFYL